MHLGKWVTTRLSLIEGDARLLPFSSVDTVFLGHASYLNHGARLYNSIVGRYVSVGPNAVIGGAEHDYNKFTTHPIAVGRMGNIVPGMSSSRVVSMPVIIGDDCWIGANAYVRQGVTLGQGVVIGSNSVVIDDVPDYAVCVGIPAKIIKYRFSSDVINILLESGWVNRSLESLPVESFNNLDFSQAEKLKEFFEKAPDLIKDFYFLAKTGEDGPRSALKIKGESIKQRQLLMHDIKNIINGELESCLILKARSR